MYNYSAKFLEYQIMKYKNLKLMVLRININEIRNYAKRLGDEVNQVEADLAKSSTSIFKRQTYNKTFPIGWVAVIPRS